MLASRYFKKLFMLKW